MRSLKRVVILNLIFLILIIISGCGGNSTNDSGNNCLEELAELENEIRNDLNTFNTDTDFTLIVKSENGNTFAHSTGNSNETMLYRSASTSKLVTAVVILSLVKDGILSLEDHPQDYISFWPTYGNLSLIKLKHLLSFTSGLVNDPICFNLGTYDFEKCVENIVTKNDNSKTPGEEFYYARSHLQVAGLMAVKASGLSSWEEVFEQFKSETGLFASSNFDLPSLQNPRLPSGMHWNAKEYLEFLEALYKKEILNTELINQMTNDQISSSTVAYSPAIDSIGEDWHYGFGTWIECHANPNNCTYTTRVSCPGAYGAYPFIDYENKYYGILAREGELGSFDKGYELFMSVSSKLKEWASIKCN